mgnify:CR=1 FL=1
MNNPLNRKMFNQAMQQRMQQPRQPMGMQQGMPQGMQQQMMQQQMMQQRAQQQGQAPMQQPQGMPQGMQQQMQQPRQPMGIAQPRMQTPQGIQQLMQARLRQQGQQQAQQAAGIPRQAQPRMPQGMPQQAQRLPQGMPQQGQLGRAQGGMIQGIQGLQRSPMGMPRNQQPAGILNSSPQLMNAAQGFKDGGMVKGYEFGGLGIITSTDDSVDRRKPASAAQLEKLNSALENFPNVKPKEVTSIFNNVIYDNSTKKYKLKPETSETSTSIDGVVPPAVIKPDGSFIEGKSLSQIELEIEKQKKQNIAEAEDYNSYDTTKPPIDPYAIGDDKKGVPFEGGNLTGVDGGSNLINNINETALNDKPNVKKEAPFETSANLLKKATKNYDTWKAKFSKADASYAVTTAKTDKYMSEIDKLMKGKVTPPNLEDVEKTAKKILNIKEGKYDEDRTTAFWMGVIKGGFKMGAGKSSRALANLSEGMLFGVESYGKDVNELNKEERQDEKDLFKLKYELIKDDKTAKIAERTMRIQGYNVLANLENKKSEFASNDEFRKSQAKTTNEMARASLDIAGYKSFHDIQMAGASFDLQLKNFAFNKQKQKDYLINIEAELSRNIKKDAGSDKVRNIIAMGPEFGSFDEETKKYTLAPKGRAIMVASMASKTKVSSMMETAKKIGVGGIMYGSTYNSPNGEINTEATERAVYMFETSYEPRLKALKEQAKDKFTGGVDGAEYKRQEDLLKEEFYKETKATGRVGVASAEASQFIKIPKLEAALAQANKKYAEGDKITNKNPISGKIETYIAGPNNTYKLQIN